MLRHPRNNLIYLGPSGIRIWAHHARQAQFGKTSGLEKLMTEKGNPRNYSSWESHEIFSGKLFFRQPKAIYLQLEALKDMPRWNDNPGQVRRSRWLKIQTLIRQSHPKRLSISRDTNHNQRATIKKTKMDAWIMYMVFWEWKCYLPGRLGKIGVGEDTRRTWRRREEDVLGISKFRGIWKIGSVKAPIERSLFYIQFVISVSAVKIEFEISILRLVFDSETWRQSQNSAWRVI